VVLTLVPVLPIDVPPDRQSAIDLLGMFNVFYTLIIRIIASRRFHAEMLLYKGRLENQSVTMLQQAKMSTLGEMAAGVAHEINNPLAMIQGNTSQMLREMEAGNGNDPKVIAKGKKVLGTVERIAKIVGALRTFSRNADSDPFQTSKMSDVLDETLNLCGENLQNNQVEIRKVGEDFEFECRPTQIAQVLINMLINSADAVAALPEK